MYGLLLSLLFQSFWYFYHSTICLHDYIDWQLSRLLLPSAGSSFCFFVFLTLAFHSETPPCCFSAHCPSGSIRLFIGNSFPLQQMGIFLYWFCLYVFWCDTNAFNAICAIYSQHSFTTHRKGRHSVHSSCTRELLSFVTHRYHSFLYSIFCRENQMWERHFFQKKPSRRTFLSVLLSFTFPFPCLYTNKIAFKNQLPTYTNSTI